MNIIYQWLLESLRTLIEGAGYNFEEVVEKAKANAENLQQEAGTIRSTAVTNMNEARRLFEQAESEYQAGLATAQGLTTTSNKIVKLLQRLGLL